MANLIRARIVGGNRGLRCYGVSVAEIHAVKKKEITLTFGLSTESNQQDQSMNIETLSLTFTDARILCTSAEIRSIRAPEIGYRYEIVKALDKRHGV